MRIGTRTVTFRSRSGRPVRLTVRIATDGTPLTPLARDSIFNRPFMAFLAEARAIDRHRRARAGWSARCGASSS
jgi:hypothetical protein